MYKVIQKVCVRVCAEGLAVKIFVFYRSAVVSKVCTQSWKEASCVCVLNVYVCECVCVGRLFEMFVIKP